ncbi:hypothetical protein ACMA5I_08565 [Paracoccaceae bacterium GXU_MW_L88]
MRIGGFILALALAGCIPGGTTVISEGDAITFPEIAGFCLNEEESRNGPESVFAVYGDCEGEKAPGELQFSLSPNDVTPPDPEVLEEFLRERSSTQFAGGEILAEEVIEDTFLIKMNDDEGHSGPVWRAFAVVEQRLMNATYIAGEDAGDDAAQVQTLFNAVNALQAANGQ